MSENSTLGWVILLDMMGPWHCSVRMLSILLSRWNPMFPEPVAKVARPKLFPVVRNPFQPYVSCYLSGMQWERPSVVLMNCMPPPPFVHLRQYTNESSSDVFMDSVNRDISMKMMVSHTFPVSPPPQGISLRSLGKAK